MKTIKFKLGDYTDGTIRRLPNNDKGDICEISAYEEKNGRFYLRYLLVPTDKLKEVFKCQ